MKPTDFIKTKKLLNESSGNAEYNDEASTSKNSLHTIIRVATHLEKAIGDDENMPEWCQEKIAEVKALMVNVMDYMISQHEMGQEEQLPSFDAQIAESAFNTQLYTPVNEDATGGAMSSASVAATVETLGQKGDFSKKDVNKKLKSYTNVISRSKKLEEAMAATAAFRAGNKKRANLNAMSDEDRRAYDKEQQEKQRKRDDARLERERQKLASKKGVAEATGNKRIRTETGTATITADGVIFNNSGEKDAFTWAEIDQMNNGKRVKGFKLDRANSDADTAVYVYPGTVEHHLPVSAITRGV